MLSQQLHDLEECGMIHREVIPEKPPKTVYSLTALGESVIPVLDAMCQWGTNYMDALDLRLVAAPGRSKPSGGCPGCFYVPALNHPRSELSFSP